MGQGNSISDEDFQQMHNHLMHIHAELKQIIVRVNLLSSIVAQQQTPQLPPLETSLILSDPQDIELIVKKEEKDETGIMNV